MDKDIFTRRKELENDLTRIQQKESKVKDKLKKITDSCNHEIILKTDEISTKEFFLPMAMKSMPPEIYCIICGKHLSNQRELTHEDVEKMRDSTVIEAKKYPSLCSKWDRNYIRKVENIYKRTKMVNPEVAESDIAQIIIKELEEEDKYL